VAKGRRILSVFAACQFGSGSKEMGYTEFVKEVSVSCVLPTTAAERKDVV